MPKRDLYRILGVSTKAAPGEIKRAYRRIAFAVHPDVGARPDPERFREAHEAYETLSDPARRHSYDVGISSKHRRHAAEAPLPKKPIHIAHDFLTLRPSIHELLDHPGRNFFGYPHKRDRTYRRVNIEAILEEDEARFGCEETFEVPTSVICPSCQGVAQWSRICPLCYGEGRVARRRQMVLNIPPGIRDGACFEFVIEDLEKTDFVMHLKIVVR
jgi:molecular chaperone DnaJ